MIMKKIKAKIKAIIELAKIARDAMSNPDKYTAPPTLYLIRYKERVYGVSEDCSDGRVYVDKNDLGNYFEEEGTNVVVDVGECTATVIEDDGETVECDIMYFKNVEMYEYNGQVFLTRKACDSYIRQNSHNLPDWCYSFAVHQDRRNVQMRKLFKAMEVLA